MNIIKSKKKFGQHFLKDLTIAKIIVQEFDSKTEILEIGPGNGVFTNFLVEQKFDKIVAIDIDYRLIEYLKSKKRFQKIHLINNDILKIDFSNLFKNQFSIVGNLPYNISSQILFKILEYRDRIGIVVIMLQKEVADRIISSSHSKKYGILSVLIQTFFKVRKIADVDSNSFDPPPKVQSSVIKLSRNDVLNIGVEFSFLENRITGSVEYYNKESIDLIYDQPLALSTGNESVKTNVGAVKNSGLEFSFNGNILSRANGTSQFKSGQSNFELNHKKSH